MVDAELSAGFAIIETLDAILEKSDIARTLPPCPALFIAAQGFRRYQAADGMKTGVY